MNCSAAFAIAPRRHNHRAVNNPGSLTPTPISGLDKRFGAIGLPVGEEQLGVGSDGMNDVGTQDAVIAVPRFEVAAEMKGLHGDPLRQVFPQVLTIAPKTAIDDRDL